MKITQTKRFADGLRYYAGRYRVHPNGVPYHGRACRGGACLNPHRLLDDPALAIDACTPAKQTALLAAAAMQTAIAASGLADAPAQAAPAAPLSIDEAAAMIGKSRRWIFQNAARLQWAKRISRKTIMCDPEGLRRWIATRGAA